MTQAATATPFFQINDPLVKDPVIKAQVLVLTKDKEGELYFLLAKEENTLPGKKPIGNIWITPGGNLEPNETHQNAALREFCEKTRYYDETLKDRILNLKDTAQLNTKLFPNQQQVFFAFEVDNEKADAIVNEFDRVGQEPSKLHPSILNIKNFNPSYIKNRVSLGWIKVHEFLKFARQDINKNTPTDVPFTIYKNLSKNPIVVEKGQHSNSMTKAIVMLLNGYHWGKNKSHLEVSYLQIHGIQQLIGKVTEL